MPWPTPEMVGTLVPSTWTVDEYEHLPNDGMRYEILDGELAMTPAPSTEHQRISRHLQFLLYRALELTGRAEVFDAPFDVELDRENLVQPDLVVVLAEHRDRLTPRRLVGPPDLAVEILSPSTAPQDLETKLRLYARFGVTGYWVVDPERRELVEYLLEGNAYRLVATARAGETFVPRVFPDLSIRLDELFAGPRR